MKGIAALLIVVGLGITSTVFMLEMAILIWLGQSQAAGAVQAATQIPLLGPLIMLAAAVAFVWVVLLCTLEVIRTIGRRK